MPVRVRSLSLNLPFGLGGMDLEVSDVEERAAWELYVEFSTRVSGYDGAGGSPREAMDSLYALFATTRDVLRRAGPSAGHGPRSVGALAIRVLNEGLRPFVARWHMRLGTSDDELEVPLSAEFEAELARLREGLAEYVEALGQIAGVL